MIEKVLSSIGLLGGWLYLILFFAVFLECSAFVGFVVPGETFVALAGFLSARGYLSFGECLLIASLGAVLGDNVGYMIGKRIGREYFETHKRLLFLKRRHLEKADEYFRKYGEETVFLSRFVGLLRAVVPFSAGLSRMHYGKFLVYNASGGIVWATGFVLLGYLFGKSWHLFEEWAGPAGMIVAGVAVVVFVLIFLRKRSP